MVIKPLAAILAAVSLLVPLIVVARTVYEAPYLACAPQYQTVSVGNAARFEVVTNAPGPFMWVTEEFGVVDAGREFVVPMMEPGVHEVSVVWGTRRATCVVEAVGYGSLGETYAYPFYGGPGPNVVLSQTFYPSMPNAGFAPIGAAAFAFAVVLLLGAAIALYPHVKRAFAVVAR